MLRKRVPRLPAFDYTGGYRYLLTICTNVSTPVFKTGRAVDLVIRQLLRSANDEDFVVIAYCFMPDHLHLLVEGVAADANLTWFVRAFKQRSGFHWKAVFGGELWQRSYYERLLPAEEPTLEVARYLLTKPVGAGTTVGPLSARPIRSVSRGRRSPSVCGAVHAPASRREPHALPLSGARPCTRPASRQSSSRHRRARRSGRR